MTITASWVARKCKTPATIVNVDPVTDDTPRDALNNPIPETTATPCRCSWWMERGTETSGTTQVAVSKMTAVFPGAPTITAESQVVIGGVTFHLNGPPVQWPQPADGSIVGTQVWLVRSS